LKNQNQSAKVEWLEKSNLPGKNGLKPNNHSGVAMVDLPAVRQDGTNRYR
jgi:hypothetical protein